MKENEPQSLDEISENQSKGLLSEFWSFLMHNKKFWLVPIIVVFVLFGILIIFGGSSVAPFIYPLF
ncbi:MAG: hypothetical protein CMI18_11110 [Opitutaceae bacterium]|nr:hypothetical protein [Opitutaceae bacterium]|tara:strand:- start:2883 stop:3080 length:198 start_codon:yes stop_codon:yes gene_type:complete